jgi:hypothetical protein
MRSLELGGPVHVYHIVRRTQRVNQASTPHRPTILRRTRHAHPQRSICGAHPQRSICGLPVSVAHPRQLNNPHQTKANKQCHNIPPPKKELLAHHTGRRRSPLHDALPRSYSIAPGRRVSCTSATTQQAPPNQSKLTTMPQHSPQTKRVFIAALLARHTDRRRLPLHDALPLICCVEHAGTCSGAKVGAVLADSTKQGYPNLHEAFKLPPPSRGIQTFTKHSNFQRRVPSNSNERATLFMLATRPHSPP